jgi:trans-aconitate methyltransferase
LLLGQHFIQLHDQHDPHTVERFVKRMNLVHARLVLEHLPERDAVLRKLVRGLKPGGWLLVDSVDYVSAVAVSEPPE